MSQKQKVDYSVLSVGQIAEEQDCSSCGTKLVKYVKEYNGNKSGTAWKSKDDGANGEAHFEMISKGLFKCKKSGEQLGKATSSQATLPGELESKLDQLTEKVGKMSAMLERIDVTVGAILNK